MRVLRPSSEEEVAEVFHTAELQGRFREQVAARTRGWRTGGLFHGLPDDLGWNLVALTPEEVLDVLYINWDWWVRITEGTRSPRDAARRLRAGLVPGGDVEWHRPIAGRLASSDPPPPLIAVAAPGGPIVVVEGHVRLTAYALFPQYLPEELEVFLGTSERVPEWVEY